MISYDKGSKTYKVSALTDSEIVFANDPKHKYIISHDSTIIMNEGGLLCCKVCDPIQISSFGAKKKSFTLSQMVFTLKTEETVAQLQNKKDVIKCGSGIKVKTDEMFRHLVENGLLSKITFDPSNAFIFDGTKDVKMRKHKNKGKKKEEEVTKDPDAFKSASTKRRNICIGASVLFFLCGATLYIFIRFGSSKKG
ncbi:hypothetical protein ECANGB1_2192 [Enterospora canceri]|uniref:Uncharacterized protein n=1 Tax=Enterospora canceri TaxID=1081671 RepID=A0A1Y1S501_9MICR|nr:hypothetical protein ECANGB1_2192 [Enterospora canceri]